ncbi:unnamed protein product, partial [Durusdinium trenchii]
PSSCQLGPTPSHRSVRRRARHRPHRLVPMLATASMMQAPINMEKNSISENEGPFSTRRTSTEPVTFKELLAALATCHEAEVETLQMRMDHLQAENRLLSMKMKDRTGLRGTRATRRTQKSVIASKTDAEEGEVEPEIAFVNPTVSLPAAEFTRNTTVRMKSQSGVAELSGLKSPVDEGSMAVPLERPSKNSKSEERSQAGEGEEIENEEEGADVHAPKSTYYIRDVWMRTSLGKTRSQQQVAALQRSQTMDRMENKRSSIAEEDTEIVGLSNGMWKHIIGSPTSPKRMIWDAIGGVMILWDIVALPLMVFDEVDGPFTDALGMIGLSYWTLNVGNTLTCGYLHNGVTIMSPWAIFKRYLTRGIFLDLVTLVPDWVVTMISFLSTNSGFQEARLLRALRAFRLTRLVRIVKLRWLMEVVRDYLDSEYASIMFEISKMMGLLLVINHVLACAWYGLRFVGVELGWTTWWTGNFLIYDPARPRDQQGWVYSYLTCLHWSLCQFTPASMEVQPTNPLERGFAALTVLFALIVFSYIVGSITGSLTQLRMMSETITRETLKLRRFLRRNAVPIGLSLRIRRFVEFELKRRQQPVNHQSVGCLAVLSEQLQVELSFALVQPTLNTHALFEGLMKSTGGLLLLEKASQSFEKKTLAMDDWEFLPYTHATSMRYLLAGELRYVRTIQSSMDNEEVTEELVIEPGGSRWISEAVMWIQDWEYVGELSATIESHLSQVDLYPASHKLLKNYANDFVMWLQSLQPDEMTDVLEPIIVTMLVRNQATGKKNFAPQQLQAPSSFPRATV